VWQWPTLYWPQWIPAISDMSHNLNDPWMQYLITHGASLTPQLGSLCVSFKLPFQVHGWSHNGPWSPRHSLGDHFQHLLCLFWCISLTSLTFISDLTPWTTYHHTESQVHLYATTEDGLDLWRFFQICNQSNMGFPTVGDD